MLIESHGTGCGRGRGFTALELMTMLAIAAILLASGIPSFQQFMRKQQMKAALGGLHNDLLAARSEAVFRRFSVVACPGSPSAGCRGTNDWTGGWIVFMDINGDRRRQPAERLVRHGQGFGNVDIHSSSGRTDFRFFPDGSAPGSNGSISLCGPGGPPEARKLVISNIGRIRRDRYEGLDPAFCP